MLFDRWYESCKFSKSAHPICIYEFAVYHTIQIWNLISKGLKVRQQIPQECIQFAFTDFHCKFGSVLHNSNTKFYVKKYKGQIVLKYWLYESRKFPKNVYPICIYGLIHCKYCSVLHNSNTQLYVKYLKFRQCFKTRPWWKYSVSLGVVVPSNIPWSSHIQNFMLRSDNALKHC